MKLLLPALISVIMTQSAQTIASLLPESRHQQFLTYGLFSEEQTGLLIRDGNRAWGALGASIALMELPDCQFKPQLILTGSVNVSFRPKTWLLDFATETFDARFGFLAEGSITESLRVAVGALHFSGHTADGIETPELVAPNLGDDQIIVRVVYDVDTTLRLGATLRPMITVDPPKQAFAMDQFLEYFPFGSSGSTAEWTPYIAGGLEQYGVDKLELSGHIQAGLQLSGHFLPKHQPTLRIVLGYYHGTDPRLKYAQFLASKVSFVYGGFLFNL